MSPVLAPAGMTSSERRDRMLSDMAEERDRCGFYVTVPGLDVERHVFLRKGYGDSIDYLLESYSLKEGWCWSDSTTDSEHGPWPSQQEALDNARLWHLRLIEEAPMRAAMADVMRGAPEKKRARETTLNEIAVLLIVIIGILMLQVLR